MLATSAAREWLTHGLGAGQAVGLIAVCAATVAAVRHQSTRWARRAMVLCGAIVWVSTLGVWSIPATAAAIAVFAYRRSSDRRPTWLTVLLVAVLSAPLVMAKMWLARTGRSVPSGALLPVGVSYLTFALIGAVIDHVRFRSSEFAEGRTFALWVTHPGTRLAGPVTRLEATAKRLSRPDGNQSRRFGDGAYWVGLGVLKKRFISDALVSLSLRGGLPASGWLVVPYLLVSAVAVYFDATGYSDFAVGVGRWFGIDVAQSFARPVSRARDLPDLWRRWQVPLMAWFRDYVYGPLRPVVGATAALAATFLLSALWHGLTSVWLCWGIVTAVLVILWTAGRGSVPGGHIFGRVMVVAYLVALASIVQLGRTRTLVGVAPIRSPWLWLIAAPVGVAAVLVAERFHSLKNPFSGRGSVLWLAAIVVAALAARWPFLPFVYQLF